MIKHSRREFINQVFATSIGSTALGRAGSAWIGSNDGLAELCVIARKPGTLPNAVVDVWTAKIGSLDFEQLPEQLGRVVVWSDIRGHRGFTRSIADILFSIHEYFGIKPVLGSSAAAHVGHYSGLSCSIEMLLNTFEPAYLGAIGRRIAVVDLSSCGLTGLHWQDIIPSLRHHYTTVVGVDYSIPELCELDAEFEAPHGLSGLAHNAMRACDYWLLGSDECLSGRVELSIEERSLEFTKSIHDLCVSLASADTDIHTALTSLAKRRFVLFGART
jgi:hypothetical protein